TTGPRRPRRRPGPPAAGPTGSELVVVEGRPETIGAEESGGDLVRGARDLFARVGTHEVGPVERQLGAGRTHEQHVGASPPGGAAAKRRSPSTMAKRPPGKR